MRKIFVFSMAILLCSIVFFTHAQSGIRYVDLTDVDATGLSDGQVFKWDATASKFKPVNLDSISGPSGGSVSFDANGDIVAANRFSSFGGRATGTESVNGAIIQRLNASRVYVGSDITNVLFYNPQASVNGIWYEVDFWGSVINTASAGTLTVSLEYKDKGGVKITPIITNFDLTQTSQPASGRLAIMIFGSPTYGLWYHMVGTGVTGSPQVDFYYQVKES